MSSRQWLAGLAVAGGIAALAAGTWPAARAAVVLGFAAVALALASAVLRADRRERAAVVRELESSLERRVTEVARERRRMERLLQRLPLAVLLFTPTGLVYANPAARELFPGAVPDGRSALRVLTHRALADAVSDARTSGHTVHREVERDKRWLSARAVVTAEGEVALVVTDQTDARRVDAVRRDFVVNASHELKTPVASMQALADTLRLAATRDPVRAAGMVDRLHTEAVRMGQLVRDLLDLARLEEQAAERRKRVDLGEVVRIEFERSRQDAREREVAVRVDVPHGLELEAVPEDLHLVVANLVGNAVRYNRPGGQVIVRARRVGGDIVLEVADTGIGLAETDRARVFERFYRVDQARSRAAGGTGLGLALVRHAVERHGGKVAVDSVLGEGSTFRVTLPASAG